MGRQLQKKKNKSSLPKVSKHKNPRVRKALPLGNALIAANWDKRQTLTQNYRRLGLISRLNKPTGGAEKGLPTSGAVTTISTSASAASGKPAPGEARIERDEEGNVVNIIYGKTAEEALDGEEGDGGEVVATVHGTTEIVRKLEAHAALGERKREREQSEREREWVGRLTEKYGGDYRAMARDLRLNPYQQTEGDIKRRVARWERGQMESCGGGKG